MIVPSIVNVQQHSVFIARPEPKSTWEPAVYRDGYVYKLPFDLVSSPVTIPDSAVEQYRTPSIDGDSWKKIRESGRIKMTPYTNRLTEKVRDVVYLDKVDSELQVAVSEGYVAQGTGIASNSWQQALAYTELMLASCPRLNDTLLDPTASSEVADVRNELYDKASKTFDALTELAELKEGIEFVHSLFRRDANVLVDIMNKIHKRGLGLNDTAAIWMSFRYALMPLLYTWRDINAVLEKVAKNPVYLTYRATRVVTPGPSHERPSSGLYASQRGTIKIRGVVKKRYDAGATAQLLMDMIGVNPVRTAYELTKLSWLLDWFINLGNVLSSFASIDLATETKCCVSVKCDFTTEYSYRDNFVDSLRYPNTSIYKPGWVFREDVHDNTYPVGRDVYDTYVRTLHDINDVPFSVGVSDTWKHWVDALAMSSRGLTDVLRTLRIRF